MKKYSYLAWILLLIVAICFCFKNLSFIKYYHKYLVDNNKEYSFSIFTKTTVNDTFFSIALGDRICHEGFQNDDILTWHEGLKFTNERWLFNVIIYEIYNIWNIEGIANFVTICTILIGILLVVVMRDRTKNIWLSLYSSLFILYFCRNVFYARAQILSFPLFILEFFLIEKLIETKKYRYSVFAIICSFFIANIHTSVYPITLVMFLPYFAEWVIDRIRDKSGNIQNIKSLLITFIFSGLVGFIVPTGFSIYTTLIRAALYTDTSFIGECQPSNIYNNLPLFILLIVSLLSLIVLKFKIKLRDLFFVAGFGIMGIMVFRGSYFFYFISGICITRLIGQIIDTYSFGLDKQFVQVIIGVSLSSILLTMYLKNFLIMQRDTYIPEDSYPIKVCDYILENEINENMRIYNDFNIGSYLEFRGIKAFIDSRSEVFTDEFNPGCTVLEDWLKIYNDSKNYENVFEKYKITHALVKNNEDIYNKLEEDDKYTKIYTDENFSLFEKGD